MNNPKNDGGKLNGKANALAVLIATTIGAVSGPFVLVRVAPDSIRPDPFTGSEGAVLRQRIGEVERIQRLHIDRHPEISGRFENRLATLEAQIDILIAELRRTNDKLDNMRE